MKSLSFKKKNGTSEEDVVPQPVTDTTAATAGPSTLADAAVTNDSSQSELSEQIESPTTEGEEDGGHSPGPSVSSDTLPDSTTVLRAKRKATADERDDEPDSGAVCPILFPYHPPFCLRPHWHSSSLPQDSDMPVRSTKRRRADEGPDATILGDAPGQPRASHLSRSTSVASTITMVGHGATPTPEPDVAHIRTEKSNPRLDMQSGGKTV